MTRFTLKSARIAITAVVALMMVAATAAVSRAQNSWTVSISEKQMKLENPSDPMWDKWLMWDLGYQRMMDRNMPYIELLNDAGSTSPITEFHLTIGDNRFNFGPLDNASPIALGSTTPGFSLTGSTIDSGDELVVTIGNGGLLPGQLVRFKINLDVDPAYAATYAASFGASQPDFRTILFDMNGKNVYDGTTDNSDDDNAEAFVVFNPGGPSSEAVFQDEEVEEGGYYNNNLREYRASDPVLIFQLGGTQIPEPTSVGLMMIGLAAGACCRRIRR